MFYGSVRNFVWPYLLNPTTYGHGACTVGYSKNWNFLKMCWSITTSTQDLELRAQEINNLLVILCDHISWTLYTTHGHGTCTVGYSKSYGIKTAHAHKLQSYEPLDVDLVCYFFVTWWIIISLTALPIGYIEVCCDMCKLCVHDNTITCMSYYMLGLTNNRIGILPHNKRSQSEV